MIKDYRALAIFVAVADTGSFSQAGRHLKLSTSVVSHHVSRLEDKLGVSLFFRSSRRVTITAEGQAMLAPARRMVAAGDEALDTLTARTEQPVGALRITMPAFGDGTRLRQLIWDFAARYPMVAISLSSSDVQVDLIRDRYDVALRLGELSDSSLKCRRIGDFQRVLVAAPSYLRGRGGVHSVEALMTCDFVSLSMLSDRITLLNGAEQVSFEPENVRLEVDSIAAAQSAVLAGLGVQRLPLGEVSAALAAGDLVQVLPSWRLPVLGVYAVWPDTGPQKRLTRRFIDHLSAPEGRQAGL